MAELRDWLRLDATNEDAVLASLVTTARLALESHTRRGFIQQVWRFTYFTPSLGGMLRLPLGPLRSLAALRCYDGAGLATTLSAEAVQITPDDQRPAVRILDAAACASCARVELDVSIGYGDGADAVPAPLRQAILMLATNWHARRGDHPEIEMTIPRAVAALAQPYRRARLA